MRPVHHHAALDELRIRAHLLHSANTAAGHTGGTEQVHPLADGARRRQLDHDRHQRVPVCDSLGCGGEPRVVPQVGPRDGVAIAAPQRVVRDGEVHPAVLRPQGLIRRDRGMVVAAPGRALARGKIVAGVVGEQRRRGVEQRDLDLLPAAGRVPRIERQGDALRRHHRGGEIGDRGADARGRTAGVAGQVHQPGLALHDQVVAGPSGIGTAAAEARDRTVDEPRMPRRHRFVVEPEPRHGARPEVLDQDIGTPEQPPQHRLPLLALQVEGATALAAVDRQVVRRLAPEKRRAERARLVAPAGLLDLDDVGAHVAEALGAERSGDDAAEVDDADALERGGAGRRVGHSLDHYHGAPTPSVAARSL